MLKGTFCDEKGDALSCPPRILLPGLTFEFLPRTYRVKMHPRGTALAVFCAKLQVKYWRALSLSSRLPGICLP